MNIYERLKHGGECNNAINDLNSITKTYRLSEDLNEK